MNFLAHLLLAGNDEGLRLGAMLGDFVRGRHALSEFEENIQTGIMLHRHIDGFTDALPEVVDLRAGFHPPFRRYAGIIIDLALDHVLARRWESHCDLSLQDFDLGIREMLLANHDLLPPELVRFMQYADRRGLFAAYREEDEMLRSFRGIGRRLSRPNPLHRVDEVWTEFRPLVSARFESIFGTIQSSVADWLKSRSTTTGS